LRNGIEYSDIVLQRERIGAPFSIPSAQIAAIYRVCGADFATLNTRDFEIIGLVLINPGDR
jgi:hypothetical protein